MDKEKNEKKNIPLSVVMENTKGKLMANFNEIINEAKLPAFLVEGILLGILADIRNQKNIELVCDYNAMNQDEKEGDK